MRKIIDNKYIDIVIIGTPDHWHCLIECVTTRNPNCNASIEIGSHIAKFSQLGNIAYRTGKKCRGTEKHSTIKKQTLT